MKFKVGDTVTPITEVKYLTMNKGYTVLKVDEDGDIHLLDDDGDTDYYSADGLKLHRSDNNIGYAESLVGSIVFVGDKNIKVEAFSVWNKFYADDVPHEMLELIKRDGYAVTVEDFEGTSYLLSEIVVRKNVIALTHTYNAIIEGENVLVGCQTIPIEKVQEILDTYKSLQ